MNRSLQAGFQHADFSASADFYARADFSAYPHMNFHHDVDRYIKRSLFCKDLDKNQNCKYFKYKIFVNGLQNKFVLT